MELKILNTVDRLPLLFRSMIEGWGTNEKLEWHLKRRFGPLLEAIVNEVRRLNEDMTPENIKRVRELIDYLYKVFKGDVPLSGGVFVHCCKHPDIQNNN